MPTLQNQTVVPLRGFAKGLVRNVSPVLLPSDALVEAVNIVIQGGSVKKRPGVEKFTTSDPAGASYGVRAFTFQEPDGTFWFIYVDVDGEVYYEDVSTGTTLVRANYGSDITLGDLRCDAVVYDGVFYLTAINGESYTFDGTSWTQITDHALNGSGSEFPLATKLILLHDRVFAFNVNDGASNNSRIRFSNAGDPLTWDTNDFIDVAPGDGGRINDVVVLGDRILIFKNYSMHVLAGVDPLTFQVMTVSDEHGTIAINTAVEYEGLVYFYDNRTGVWATDGNNFQFIGEPIAEFIRDQLDPDGDYWTYPHSANAYIHENRYHLGLPTGGTEAYATETFVFDFDEKAWTWWSFAVQDTLKRDQNIFGVGFAYEDHPTEGDVGPLVGIHTLYVGNADVDASNSAVAFTAAFTTGWITPVPEVGFMGRATLNALRYYHRNGNSGVFVYYDFDGTDYDDLITGASLQTINDVLDIQSHVLTSWHPGEHYAFAIGLDNFSTEAWDFHGLDLFFTVRPTTSRDESTDTVRQRWGS